MAAPAYLAALCTLFMAVIMLAAGIHEEDCLEYFEANSEYADLSKVPTYSRMIGYKRRSIAPGRTLHLDVSGMPLQSLAVAPFRVSVTNITWIL